MTYIKNYISITFIIILIMMVSLLPMNTPVGKNTFSFQEPSLFFEKNRGQFDSKIDFVSRNDPLNLYLASDHAKISFDPLNKKNHIKIIFVDANQNAQASGINQESGKVNYFSGQKKETWQHNISTYKKIFYESVYPGIDLVYYGNNGEFEYDFIVAPDIDYQTIKLKFEGAEKLELSKTGDLLLHTEQGIIVQKSPLVYQGNLDDKQIIESQYLLADNSQVLFQIADYDKTRPLIIDPVLTYSSYLGSTGNEEGNDIAVDSNGNIYIIGSTTSVNFPINNPLQGQHGGGEYDLFISKFDTDNKLVFTTYLGGSGDDKGLSVAVDDKGYIYIAGETNSRDFPMMSPTQSTLAGDKNCGEGKTDCSDAFIAKLSGDGSKLLFSTYLGGDNIEIARSIVVDDEENVYIAGVTTSYNFPIKNEIQSTLRQQEYSEIKLKELCGIRPNVKNRGDIFISKIDTNNINNTFSTYFGGACIDAAFGIALDDSKNIFVTGMTASPDFPVQIDSNLCSNSEIEKKTCLPFQGDFKFQTDVFLLKLNAEGNKILYATYFGDAGTEVGLDVAVDSTGAAYITGYTDSPNLGLLSPFQGKHGGGRDAFIAKFSAEKGGLIYSSYLGGDKDDEGHSIAVNDPDEIYIAGKTISDNFPVCNPVRGVSGGKGDAFIAKFYDPSSVSEPKNDLCKPIIGNNNPNLLKLGYSSYLGGSAKDSIKSIALTENTDSEIFLVGKTKSRDLTTVSPLTGFTTNQGEEDLFIAKLQDRGDQSDLSIVIDDVQDPVEGEEELNYIITITNQGPSNANDIIISATYEGFNYISHAIDVDNGECLLIELGIQCTFDTLAVNNQAIVNVLVRATRGGIINNTARIVRANQSDPDLLNNSDIEETKVGIKGGGGILSAINLLFLLFCMVLLTRKRL